MEMITEQEMDELVELAAKSTYIIQVEPGWFVLADLGEGKVSITSEEERAQRFSAAKLDNALLGAQRKWEEAKALSVPKEDK